MGVALGPQDMPLPAPSAKKMSAGRNRNLHPLTRDEPLVGRAEGPAHSTRRVHISLRDPSPARPRTSNREHAPPLNLPVWGQVGWQVPAGGGHARADSTVKMITNEAELPCPQGHDHPLGTFIFLKTPVNATVATILVPAAAFGGAHAGGWPALPLHLQVTSPFAPAWSTHGT